MLCIVNGHSTIVPDTRIAAPDPSYRYEACNGFGASLAVFEPSGRCIGWIDTRALGYETAREWLAAKNA